MAEIVSYGGAGSGERLPCGGHSGRCLSVSVLLVMLVHRVVLLSTVCGSCLPVALLLLGFLLLALVLVLKEITNILLIYSFRGLL